MYFDEIKKSYFLRIERGASMKKNMPKISACAIVKNEEKNLPT